MGMKVTAADLARNVLPQARKAGRTAELEYQASKSRSTLPDRWKKQRHQKPETASVLPALPGDTPH